MNELRMQVASVGRELPIHARAGADFAVPAAALHQPAPPTGRELSCKHDKWRVGRS